jgi:hypothetical protein
VTNFENLGRDSMLVVPCPSNEDNQIYSSIAPFMRAASMEQIEQFWKTSARIMKENLKKKVKQEIEIPKNRNWY